MDKEILQLLQKSGMRVGNSALHSALIEESKELTARAKKIADPGAPGAELGCAACAILSASAACESRLSEYLAHWEFIRGPLPTEIAKLREIRDGAKQWRILIRSLVPDYKLGECHEFLHLGCLYRLRDQVAHCNSRLRRFGEPPEKVADCFRQGIIPLSDKSSAIWPIGFISAEVAEWASECADAWIKKADKYIPLSC